MEKILFQPSLRILFYQGSFCCQWVELHLNSFLTHVDTLQLWVQMKAQLLSLYFFSRFFQEPMADTSMNAQELKKALEWELSLDSRDLRSHAWYHGAIPRSRAEDIVREEGGFLVRDCTSQPGNYVLTCRTKGQALHFVINKLVIQPDTVYERVQFQVYIISNIFIVSSGNFKSLHN